MDDTTASPGAAQAADSTLLLLRLQELKRRATATDASGPPLADGVREAMLRALDRELPVWRVTQAAAAADHELRRRLDEDIDAATAEAARLRSTPEAEDGPSDEQPDDERRALVRCPTCGSVGQVLRIERDLGSAAALRCPACGLRWGIELSDAALRLLEEQPEPALADGSPDSSVPPDPAAATGQTWAARVRGSTNRPMLSPSDSPPSAPIEAAGWASPMEPTPASQGVTREGSSLPAWAPSASTPPDPVQALIARLHVELDELEQVRRTGSTSLPTLDGGSPARIVWQRISVLQADLTELLEREDPSLREPLESHDPWPMSS